MNVESALKLAREAFRAYLSRCDECAIEPDIGGAFNGGWQAALATQPAAVPPTDEQIADIAEAEFKAGRLNWAGFEKDASGVYMRPVVSRSVCDLVRAAAHGIGAHDVYTNADPDRPAVICDKNGEVVLDLCKRCGKAEVELSGACIGAQAQPVAAQAWNRDEALRMIADERIELLREQPQLTPAQAARLEELNAAMNALSPRVTDEMVSRIEAVAARFAQLLADEQANDAVRYRKWRCVLQWQLNPNRVCSEAEVDAHVDNAIVPPPYKQDPVLTAAIAQAGGAA